MTEKYLWAGGAAVAGLVLGFVMSSGSEQDALVTQQMEDMQAELAAAVASVSGKVDEVAGGLAASETAVAALNSTLTAQSASLEALGAKAEANAAALVELGGALDGLSGDQAGLSDTVAGMTGDMGQMRDDLMVAMQDTLAAAAAAVGMTGGPPVPAAAAPEPAVPAAAPAPDDADDGAEAEALAAAIGDDGLILGVGQTAMVGDVRVFLSRLSDSGAHLRIKGMDPVTAGIGGGAADVGGDCVVALAGIAAGKAYMTSACAEPAVADAAPAEVPGAAKLVLTVGQTGLFGDQRVFLSRLDGGTAHLRIFTLTGQSETAAVASHQPHVMENGCGIALAGLDGRTATFQATCGDGVADLSDMATEVAAAPAVAAEPDPAPEPEPRLADTLSDSGLELRVGQTATIGEVKLFVQRLPGNTVQLMQVGGGALTLDVFRPIDLGNGCTVSLLGVQDGAAYVEPACAE